MFHLYNFTLSLPPLLRLFCDTMDCNLPVSSVLGIFQARILEQVAISSCRGSFWPRDWARVFLRPLHWQADSLSLESPGKPTVTMPHPKYQTPSLSRCEWLFLYQLQLHLRLPLWIRFSTNPTIELVLLSDSIQYIQDSHLLRPLPRLSSWSPFLAATPPLPIFPLLTPPGFLWWILPWYEW